MEPDEQLPDCCFVEDPAVVLDGTALIPNMSQPGRNNEVRSIHCLDSVMCARKSFYVNFTF